jgi:hypothetical protein
LAYPYIKNVTNDEIEKQTKNKKKFLSFVFDKMSVDCGQFSGTNNCRFSNAAGSYFQLEDAYADQPIPSAALSMQSYCAKGKNPMEVNGLASFENQAFGAFNQAPNAYKK